MSVQPPSDRFQTEVPQVPGVSVENSRPTISTSAAVKPVIALLALVLVAFVGARWGLRPKHGEPTTAEQQPQIEVPTAAPDPNSLLPHATADAPGIAEVAEMAKPWSSKEFYFRAGLTGENIPAMLIRLPVGSPAQANGYWAFSLNAPYGNCRLEYLADVGKLKSDYGFSSAKHPMVGNPCSRTVFDPLKMSDLAGNVFVRGGIVQGSDLRPPLGIEIKVQSKNILAVRME